MLMYSQSTSGSTQPGERPSTARSGDVSSTRQHSIMGHVATEEDNHCSYMEPKTTTNTDPDSYRSPTHPTDCIPNHTHHANPSPTTNPNPEVT